MNSQPTFIFSVLLGEGDPTYFLRQFRARNLSLVVTNLLLQIRNQLPQTSLSWKKPGTDPLLMSDVLQNALLDKFRLHCLILPIFSFFYAGINKDGTGPYRKAESGIIFFCNDITHKFKAEPILDLIYLFSF